MPPHSTHMFTHILTQINNYFDDYFRLLFMCFTSITIFSYAQSFTFFFANHFYSQSFWRSLTDVMFLLLKYWMNSSHTFLLPLRGFYSKCVLVSTAWYLVLQLIFHNLLNVVHSLQVTQRETLPLCAYELNLTFAIVPHFIFCL